MHCYVSDKEGHSRVEGPRHALTDCTRSCTWVCNLHNHLNALCSLCIQQTYDGPMNSVKSAPNQQTNQPTVRPTNQPTDSPGSGSWCQRTWTCPGPHSQGHHGPLQSTGHGRIAPATCHHANMTQNLNNMNNKVCLNSAGSLQPGACT